MGIFRWRSDLLKRDATTAPRRPLRDDLSVAADPAAQFDFIADANLKTNDRRVFLFRP